jgi:hypothetical protein
MGLRDPGEIGGRSAERRNRVDPDSERFDQPHHLDDVVAVAETRAMSGPECCSLPVQGAVSGLPAPPAKARTSR